MFVRWLQRKRTQGGRTVHWRAILVEARRVNGKPTQRHIAYLGGITKADVADVEARVEFWAKASGLLDEHKITGGDRKKIEAALAAQVPRPTGRQLKQRSAPASRQPQQPDGLERQQEIAELEFELEELQELG